MLRWWGVVGGVVVGWCVKSGGGDGVGVVVVRSGGGDGVGVVLRVVGVWWWWWSGGGVGVGVVLR